jgi:hypothetical protein
MNDEFDETRHAVKKIMAGSLGYFVYLDKRQGTVGHNLRFAKEFMSDPTKSYGIDSVDFVGGDERSFDSIHEPRVDAVHESPIHITGGLA